MGESFEASQEHSGTGGSTATSSTTTTAGGAGGTGGTTQASGGAGGSTATTGTTAVGGAGGTTQASGGAGGTGGTGGTGGGTSTCDPAEVVPDAVFVSHDDGDDTSGVGSQSSPVKTLGKGLAIAVATSKTTVVLDQGTYAEAIALGPQHGGITIAGGWDKTGTVWERDCSAAARDKTLLRSPSRVGLSVKDATTKIALRTMSVQASSAAPAGDNEPGASCYGLRAQGAAVALALDDVVVRACKGGNGGLGSKVLPAPMPDCTVLTGGACKGGAEGTSGGDGPSASAAGTYTALGYSPAGGSDGASGYQGQNGTPGASGNSATCVNMGCSGEGGVCGGYCGDANGSTTVTAKPGQCGCGGRGGAAGAGGPGGGGSFGIFASGAATVVSVTGSVIESSDGGNGSPGQTAGAGGQGGAPIAGSSAQCGGHCERQSSSPCNCVQPGTYTLPGGAKGGPGGNGGHGGKGGGGAGGPSIAVLRHGGATVLADGKSELKFGTGGQAGDGKAAVGAAAKELSAP